MNKNTVPLATLTALAAHGYRWQGGGTGVGDDDGMFVAPDRRAVFTVAAALDEIERGVVASAAAAPRRQK